MNLILMFLAIALSIAKANAWIVVPSYVIVFIWGSAIFGWMVGNYVNKIKSNIDKKLLGELAKYKSRYGELKDLEQEDN